MTRTGLHAGAAALQPFLVTRAAVLAAAVLATVVIGIDPPPVEQAAWRVSEHAVANLPARWDAYWYTEIALKGYQWNPAAGYQQNVVFFPAYPLAMRGLHRLTGVPVVWCGVVISLAAFAWATLLFKRVARVEVGEEASGAAVWFLATYPFAVFFSAAYTESLFLLALLGAWQAGRQRQPARVAAWGLLLGLTRPNGFMMSLPLAWLWWQGRRRSVSEPCADAGLTTIGLAAASAPVVGAALYSAFLWWQFGEPLAWVSGQAAWGSLVHGLGTPIDPRWGPALPGRPSDVIVHGANAVATLFVLGSLVPIGRRFSPAHALVVALGVIPALLGHGILSIGRFSSVLFPLFLWLAVVIPPRQRRRWSWSFLVAQMGIAALHYSWRIMT